MSDDLLTKIEYACIHLRVPGSGNAELDDMIKRARQVDFAERFLVSGMMMLTESTVTEEDLFGLAKDLINALDADPA